MNMTAERRLFPCGFASFLRSAPCRSGNYAEVASGFIALGNLGLCPETWGIDPLRHRFKILVNMSRLARSQVEKAFFRNAAGNVQRVWQRPAGGDAAKPSKPARGKGGASWLRNQGALKHRETAGMPSPVWTAGRLNAESVKSLGRLSV